MNPLLRKCLLTCGAIFIYKVGTYITIPFIDSGLIGSNEAFVANPLLNFISMFSAGRFDNASIFALGISPFVSASIFCQLIFNVVPSLIEKKKREGNTIVNKYTRYIALPLAFVQSLILVRAIINASRINSNIFMLKVNLLWFGVVTVASIVAGTMFLVYLSDLITTYGIGSGTSMIIVASILSNDLNKDLSLVRSEKKLILYLFVLVISIFCIAYVELALRQIPLTYPQKQKGMKILQSFTTHLPIKINQAGVTPPIFAYNAMAGMTLAATSLINIFNIKNAVIIDLGAAIQPVLLATLIILMSFVYTNITFNPVEVSEYLQKPMGIIPKIRPGVNTSRYIEYVTKRLTLLGGIYICFISFLPRIITRHILNINIPGTRMRLAGASLLITIVVILELISKISTQIVTNKSFNNNKFL